MAVFVPATYVRRTKFRLGETIELSVDVTNAGPQDGEAKFFCSRATSAPLSRAHCSS